MAEPRNSGNVEPVGLILRERPVLGIGVMSVMVVACNRVVWRPLYRLAERRYRLT